MKSRVEEATRSYESGYSCAQAVFSTYADLFGMSSQTAVKLTAALGGGIGRMRETCGAVIAMAMLAGLKDGSGAVPDLDDKEALYEQTREMSDLFQAENGSIKCKELLGIKIREQSARPQERTKEYYENRPCSRLVACAAKIVEEILLEDMD